jgi:hypothetical protein
MTGQRTIGGSVDDRVQSQAYDANAARPELGRKSLGPDVVDRPAGADAEGNATEQARQSPHRDPDHRNAGADDCDIGRR